MAAKVGGEMCGHSQNRENLLTVCVKEGFLKCQVAIVELRRVKGWAGRKYTYPSQDIIALSQHIITL